MVLRCRADPRVRLQEEADHEYRQREPDDEAADTVVVRVVLVVAVAVQHEDLGFSTSVQLY